MILAVVLVAAACAEESDGRRFANDPRTPAAETTEPATPATDAGPRSTRVLPSPEALVERRGAPSTVYVYVDGALRSVSGSAVQVVVEDEVVAYAASPSGHQVAVLTANPRQDVSEMVYMVTVRAADGEPIQTFDDIPGAPGNAATPAADSMATPIDADRQTLLAIDLSWAAQGDRLLMTHSEGYLVDIPLDGEPRLIETRASIEGAFQADWSPRGDKIGVLVRDGEGRGELALITPGDAPAGINVIAPAAGSPESASSVEAFAWRANGSGVFFLEMQRTDNAVRDGAIIEWDQQSNSISIVATGGQAGPAGSVTWFSVSPDGRAVMYRVALPTDTDWSFNGLYVRSLNTGQVYRVPVRPTASVTEAWWLDEGLVWSQVSNSQEAGTVVEIVMIDASGTQAQLASYVVDSAATPAATPISGATPQATPGAGGATPVASPAATPMASPVATPVASPPAIAE